MLQTGDEHSPEGLDAAADTPSADDNDLTWDPPASAEPASPGLDDGDDLGLDDQPEAVLPGPAPEQPPPGEAPAAPVYDPNKIDWAKTPEERAPQAVKLAETDPEALYRGSLRYDDYTRKTTEAAESKRAVETEREQLGRERVEFEQLKAQVYGQAGQPPAAGAETGEPSLVGPLLDGGQLWVNWYYNTTGREPSQPDMMQAMTRQHTAASIQPLLGAAESATQQQDRAEAQAAQQAGMAEWDAICTEYPVAATPELEQAVLDKLQQWGIGVSKELVRDAFNAVVLPGLTEARTRGVTAAHQATAQQRKAAPSAPPASGGPARVDYGNTPGEIARNLKRDPAVRAALDR